MKLRDVADQARLVVQDTRDPKRILNDTLHKFANQSVKRLALLRPDLYNVTVPIECQPNSFIVDLPQDCMRLTEVECIAGSNATVVETDRDSMDYGKPNWRMEPQGPATDWMRNPRKSASFWIYPRAPENQSLLVTYAKQPRDYTPDEEVEVLSDVWFPVLVDIVIFLIQSMSDEAVNSNRAALFRDNYLRAISSSLDSRLLIDRTDSAVGMVSRNEQQRQQQQQQQ